MKSALLITAFSLLMSVSAAQAASDVFIDQIGQNLSPVATNQMVSIEDVAQVASNAAGMIQATREQFNPTTSSAALLVQTGDLHNASISQTGPGNLGIVMQSGLMNSALVSQSGSGNNALILQSGYRNFASVTQAGSNHSAFVAQQGSGNVAIISQR